MESSRRMLHGGRLVVKKTEKVLYLQQLWKSLLQTSENTEHYKRDATTVTPTRVFCTTVCAGSNMVLPTGSKFYLRSVGPKSKIFLFFRQTITS